MIQFKALLKHDDGQIEVTVWDEDLIKAIDQITNVELCPLSAIKRIEQVGT